MRAVTAGAMPPPHTRPYWADELPADPAPDCGPAARSIGAIAEAIASSQCQLRQAIAEAAYYRAEQRGFSPGHELEDWLAAQQQISGVNET